MSDLNALSGMIWDTGNGLRDSGMSAIGTPQEAAIALRARA